MTATEDQTDDWTAADGRTNSSDAFNRIVDHVERIIRNSAHDLMSGRADTTAAVIVAQLAHVHGMRPTTSD